MPVETRCFSNSSDVWSTRDDTMCITVRPAGRAGHGSAFDSDRNIVWVFGGYTTYYPYLSTDGLGSGFGVSSVGTGGFTPYPSYDYFRNDLWYYNLTDYRWYEVLVDDDASIPDARMDMVFLLIGDILFVHGGFSDNYIYGDTWYFNITVGQWLQKTTFVRPTYPASCTDDFKFIEANNCTELLFPRVLERDSITPYDILPYSQQPYYWPDSSFGPYYGIVSKDFAATHRNKSHYTGDGGSLNLSLAAEGTPIFPYAATGVMQYAKPFSFPYNATHNATLVASCMSVFGEPTRGRTLDGKYGRASSAVIVPQPRPRKPGWDGCRDRADGRSDLPAGLQYVQPLPRYGHRAIYNPNTTEIIMYGGMAYHSEQPKSLTTSYSQGVLNDMWYYNFNHCVNNCSFNGDCYFGFCFCYVGFYGVDCSNMSCPGTFCYYNYTTNEQVSTPRGASVVTVCSLMLTVLVVLVDLYTRLPCRLLAHRRRHVRARHREAAVHVGEARRKQRHLQRLRHVDVRSSVHHGGLQREGLPIQLLVQRVVFGGVSSVAVQLPAGVLRRVLSEPDVSEQLLVPQRRLQHHVGSVRVQHGVQSVQQLAQLPTVGRRGLLVHLAVPGRAATLATVGSGVRGVGGLGDDGTGGGVGGTGIVSGGHGG